MNKHSYILYICVLSSFFIPNVSSPAKNSCALWTGSDLLKAGTRTWFASGPCSAPPPFSSSVKQMLVLEVSLIRPTFSVLGVERGGASLMYGTRCPLPDVVQAYMQVWHEVFRAGRELINLLPALVLQKVTAKICEVVNADSLSLCEHIRIGMKSMFSFSLLLKGAHFLS